MVFSSYIFLCFFLPLVFILHSVVKNNAVRNGLLIIASLLFYTYGEPVYIILLLVSVLINYIFGRAIGENKSEKENEKINKKINKKKNKVLLFLAVFINIGLLVFFKYTGLAKLPIGISFYTFQALSYIVDVYRQETKAQRNLFSLLLYISFFPQLIAGPIVKYHDVQEQIDNRKPDIETVKNGIIRFSAGLSKKILISNAVAYVADSLFALGNGSIGICSAWLAAFTYLMQIYFDFSGYSDMAIGLGQMFGFHFLENFNYPYMSDSVQEFWRRWHISLSTWFKEYLYIPLGGNRKGKVRTYINKYIVFAATGIWHGANWTFLFWGLFHGTFLVLEDTVLPIKKIKMKFIRIVYTLLVVITGFVMFRADNIRQGLYIIGAMFGAGANGFKDISNVFAFINPYYLFIYAVAIIGCTEYPRKLFDKLVKGNQIVYMILSIIGVALCFLALASESYNPFIYFRF